MRRPRPDKPPPDGVLRWEIFTLIDCRTFATDLVSRQVAPRAICLAFFAPRLAFYPAFSEAAHFLANAEMRRTAPLTARCVYRELHPC
jgi:hypothetical protein